MKPEALTGLLAWAHSNAPKPEAELPRRLREHLGADLTGLDVVTKDLSAYDHVNLQVALDAYLEHGDATAEIIGLSMEHGFRAGLAEIAQRGAMYGHALDPGPVEYVGGREIACIKAGIVLVSAGEQRLAVLLAPPQQHEGGGLRLEAMAADRAFADAWLARISD